MKLPFFRSQRAHRQAIKLSYAEPHASCSSRVEGVDRSSSNKAAQGSGPHRNYHSIHGSYASQTCTATAQGRASNCHRQRDAAGGSDAVALGARPLGTRSDPRSLWEAEKSRRHVPLSSRMRKVLSKRMGNDATWILPSKRAASGHLTAVNKAWRKTITSANLEAYANGTKTLPSNLVLYSGRHTFATDMLAAGQSLSNLKE